MLETGLDGRAEICHADAACCSLLGKTTAAKAYSSCDSNNSREVMEVMAFESSPSACKLGI